VFLPFVWAPAHNLKIGLVLNSTTRTAQSSCTYQSFVVFATIRSLACSLPKKEAIWLTNQVSQVRSLLIDHKIESSYILWQTVRFFYVIFGIVCLFCNLHFKFYLETNLAGPKLIFRLGYISVPLQIQVVMCWCQFYWATGRHMILPLFVIVQTDSSVFILSLVTRKSTQFLMITRLIQGCCHSFLHSIIFFSILLMLLKYADMQLHSIII
jgi:hypothetical protein